MKSSEYHVVEMAGRPSGSAGARRRASASQRSLLSRCNPHSLSVLLFVLLCFAGYAQAQQELREPPGKWWKEPGVIDELKLTADQQTKIESIWMQNRRSLIDENAELAKRRLDLSEILSQPSINESAALKAFERADEARRAIERSRFLMRVRIKNVLSPEQQERLERLADRIRRNQRPDRVAPAAPPSPNVPGILGPPPQPVPPRRQ